MNQKVLAGLLALCVLGGASVLVRAWGEPSHLPDAPPVRTAPAVPAPRPPASRGSFPGVVLPAETVELVAPFEGRLERFHAELGERVARGASVATLDVRALRQELRSAEAALAVAQAEAQRADVDAEDAAAELEVRRRLLAGGNVSAEEHRAGESAHRRALARQRAEAARVAERRAQCELLRQRLEDSELRAPFDARVAERLLDAGGWVRAGTPVVRLISADALRVRFAVPEQDAGALTVGARVSVALGLPPVSHIATVEHVAPEVDLASGRVLALARLGGEGPDGARASAGMSARVTLPATAAEAVAGSGHGGQLSPGGGSSGRP